MTEPTSYQLAILGGLNRTGRHIYGGTVAQHVVDRRRAANKVARASRRHNRG
jgi:hypothetical protein